MLFRYVFWMTIQHFVQLFLKSVSGIEYVCYRCFRFSSRTVWRHFYALSNNQQPGKIPSSQDEVDFVRGLISQLSQKNACEVRSGSAWRKYSTSASRQSLDNFLSKHNLNNRHNNNVKHWNSHSRQKVILGMFISQETWWKRQLLVLWLYRR